MEDEAVLSNVNLSGFREVDQQSMAAVRKIVQGYVSKIEGAAKNYESLSLVLKQVHESEKTAKFDLKGRLLDNGKVFNAETVDRNLLFAVDKVLSILEHDLKK